MLKKSILKNCILTTMSFMLILASAFPVLAADTGSQSDPSLLIASDAMPDHITYSAIVKEREVVIDSGVVVGISAEANGSLEHFNIFEDTLVIDNEKAIAGDLSSLKPGETIWVYASTMKTRSLPPQSRAFAVLTNMSSKAPAKYLTVMSLDKDADGTVSILDTNNEYIARITKDTIILPYKTKQIVRAEDIKIGSRILVWSEIMTMSIPAQMTADQVMLLPEAETPFNGKVIIYPLAKMLSVNGQEVSLEDDEMFYDVQGNTMLPLRRVAEMLGYKVKWIQDSRSILLNKEDQSISLQIGNRQCDGLNLLLAPEIKSSKTFVSVEFLKEVLGMQVSIDDIL